MHVHHRTVIGRKQRMETRAKIVDASMNVFASKGPYTAVVEDIVRAAGISRGTFYYYFDTLDALRSAAVETISDKYIAEVNQHFNENDIANPILRFATAIRLYQRRATVDPLFAALVTSANRVSVSMQIRGIADLSLALKQGLIDFHSAEAAFTMAVALNLYAARYPGKDRPAHLRTRSLLRILLRAMRADEALIRQALSIRLRHFRH